MKLAKRYDVGKLIDDAENIKEAGLRVWTHDRQLCIFVGPKGVLVACSEGVGYKFDSVEDKYEVDLGKGPRTEVGEDGKERTFTPMMPAASCKVPIKDLIEEAECTEVEFGHFVRTFGGRLESNYRAMLKAIKEIGLNPEDYPRPEKKERTDARHAAALA